MLESWGCGLYTSAAYTRVFTVFVLARRGSLQSARQRGVRGMRGTQKIKKEIKKYISKYKKKKIKNGFFNTKKS